MEAFILIITPNISNEFNEPILFTLIENKNDEQALIAVFIIVVLSVDGIKYFIPPPVPCGLPFVYQIFYEW